MGADNPNKFNYFGMSMNQGDHSNYAELFITPKPNKTDPTDLSRSILLSLFDSRDEVTKFVNFVSKCQRTGNVDGLKDAQNHLYGKAAIKGRATALSLQFGTGTIAPDVILDTTDGGIKGRIGKVFKRDTKRQPQPVGNNGYHDNNFA